MRKFLQILLDVIFPPDEEALLVRSMRASDVQNRFRQTQCHTMITLSDFHDPYIRALIHEAKFHYNKHAWALLHELIVTHLNTESVVYDCLIPIPLSKRRARERGHNQVVSILESKPLPIPLYKDALLRIRHTQPQTNLHKIEREHNLKNTFLWNQKYNLIGMHILLVDDVMTTGTTLKEAEEALKLANPASITLLALAH